MFLVGCDNQESNKSQENGDVEFSHQVLNESTYHSAPEPEVVYEQPKSPLDLLEEDGYIRSAYNNGNMPKCYNYRPQTGEYASSLHITVGNGADVVVKLMDYDNDICVRYVYINAGTSFSVGYIPEGRYYLKLAYGKNFYAKNEGGKCIGKFANNALYEKGQDIMDFNVDRTFDGVSIPSYQLKLDVITSDRSNGFSSSNISEDNFNL